MVRQHEIGAIAGANVAELVSQPEKFGRIPACHVHGFRQGEMEQLHGIAYAARHVDVGAGQAPVLVETNQALDDDMASS